MPPCLQIMLCEATMLASNRILLSVKTNSFLQATTFLLTSGEGCSRPHASTLGEHIAMLGAQVEGDRLRAQPKSKETGCTPCPNFESDNAGIESWTQAASCSYGIVK